jgi:phosphatidylglycerol:prolipoprotein diacylglycerol transferase
MMEINFAHGAAIHLVLEACAYFAGFRYFIFLRRGTQGALFAPNDALWVCAGAIFGAAVGSKIVFWLQYSDYVLAHWREPAVLFGGKTIVGGLFGGVIGVELVKHLRGISHSTGDLFVFPLMLGMMIGRLGCFFAGIDDNTYGNPTALPWGVSYGDGIARHPVMLYEIAFLALLWLAIRRLRPGMQAAGDAFRIFMASYFAFRFAVDFMKPPHFPVRSILEQNVPAGNLYFGMFSGIQLTCLAGLAYYLRSLCRIAKEHPWRK